MTLRVLTRRNGVILGHVLGARNGDTAAVSRGGAASFTATFEIVAADKAGGRVKKETICAGTSIAAPSCPWPPNLPLAARTTLAIPTCPRGRRGQRTRRQPLC